MASTDERVDVPEMGGKKGKKDKPVNLQGRLVDALKANPTKFVDRLLAQSAPKMSRAAARWRRYRAKYRMGLSYLNDLTTKPPNFFANYIYANVNVVKQNLPRGLPSVIVESIDVDDKPGDDLLSKLVRSELARMRLRHKLKHGALHHAAITGLGWLKVFVQEDADGNTVNCLQAYPPENIIVDHLAIPFYDATGRMTARYIIERRPDVSIEEVQALFPDFEPKMDEDGYIEGFQEKLIEGQHESDREKADVGKTADLLECWINTFDMEKPWWRVILWGNLVVKDPEPSPYDHPYAPYVPVWVGYDDGAEDFYQAAIGEIEEIEPLQDKANMLDLQIFKNIRLIVNRQRVVNKALGLSASNVDNTENRVYAVPGDPSKAIHWDNPPMLTTDVYTYRTMVDYLIEVVSGITGTQAGRKPTGIQAAKAIQQLSANSDRGVEDRKDDIAFAIERVAEMVLSNIFQFWDDVRTVRLLDGGLITVVGDYPDSLKDASSMDKLLAGPEEPAEGGPAPVDAGFEEEPVLDEEETEPSEDREAELEQLREEWKAQNQVDLVLSDLKRSHSIRVSMDSPLPESKAERSQTVIDAFRLDLIDRRAALDGMEWPDREQILARMGEGSASDAKRQEAQQGDQQQLLEQMFMMLQQLVQMQQAGAVPGAVPVAGPQPQPPQPAQPGAAGQPDIAALLASLGGGG